MSIIITTHPKCRLTSSVEEGRGGFRLSVAIGIAFDTPPQSGLLGLRFQSLLIKPDVPNYRTSGFPTGFTLKHTAYMVFHR
jgi:hypothetical protein